jgi:metallo-beta-lactamase class B
MPNKKMSTAAKNASWLLALLWLSSPLVHADLRSDWNVAQKPFQVYGNTYYVGTQGLGSILITAPTGHVLIDGALPESASLIVANIRALGFRIEDVKLILNSHVHFDHAGGIAELQKLSGAVVAASASSAKVLESGAVDKDDPQYGLLPPIARVTNVKVFKDGEIVKVGSLAMTAHLTPGHTPGGTSWTWQSCEQSSCLKIVYADSLNPISAEGFLYSDRTRDPNGEAQLEKSFAKLMVLPCDILLVPHPGLVDLFGKLAKRDQVAPANPFVDATACRAYVQASREKLKQRIAGEQAR